jgi:uroporphyrinogen-III synthase
MTLPLSGRTLALAEGRQQEELAQMLEKEGATTLRCPMVNILDAPDAGPILAWLHELIAGRFGFVILMTGEGLRRLLGFADRASLREQVIAALGQTRTITRGPKPVRALKEIGLTPTRVAETPTTDGVIATLMQEPIQGQSVGVQLYEEANPALVRYLESAGATVRTVVPYVYAPAMDADRIVQLIERLACGEIDALLITSSPQTERLFEVAAERGLTELLRKGLQRTHVAAVGPVVAESLRRRGIHVDVCPEQGFVMKNLVQQLKRVLAR